MHYLTYLKMKFSRDQDFLMKTSLFKLIYNSNIIFQLDSLLNKVFPIFDGDLATVIPDSSIFFKDIILEVCLQLDNLFSKVFPISDGDLAIIIPQSSMVLILSIAPPLPPEIIAPA